MSKLLLNTNTESSESKIQGEGRTFYALDCSGSVGCDVGSINYFPMLLRMIDKSPKNSMFIRWDDCSTICSVSQIMDWIMSKKGYGGTNPICFVKDIPADFGPNDSLIIVSDGQISASRVPSFIQAMNSKFQFGHKFKQIQVILINTGGAIDLSIVSAFTKYDCDFILEEFEQHGALKSSENTNFYRLFDTLRDMEYLSDFTLKIVESMRKFAIGCSQNDRIVIQLREEIKRLMRKFQEELDRNSQGGNPDFDNYVQEMRKENPDFSVLTRLVERMNSAFHLKRETGGNPLINLIRAESVLTTGLSNFGINAGLHNSGNGLSGLAAANAAAAEEVEPEKLEMACCDFEDPILGGTTLVIVPISDNGISLLPEGNISQIKKFPQLLNIKDGTFLAAIGFDGFIGTVQNSQSLKHPLTREKMRDVGIIIPPMDANQEEMMSIVIFNNAAIAKLLFKGKQIGDPNLFYFCFALKMLSTSFLEEFYQQIEKEIRWRLVNGMTCSTLCGKSTEFPHDAMSILNALMFTVLSACVCKTSSENPLLMHVSYLWKIKKLLKIAEIQLPELVLKHLGLIQTAIKLIGINKADQNENGGKMRLSGFRKLIGWKIETIDGFFYPTGVCLNEEEQLEQNEILKNYLQEIVGFPIEIDEFCSLYDLFIKQNDFLKLPHIPFGLSIAISPYNFTLMTSRDEVFRRAVVDYVNGKKFDKLPSFEYMCSKLYITKPEYVFTKEVWDELVASELDTDDKIASFCEMYKFVPQCVSRGGGGGGIPRTQHSTRFGRKTRRRWLGLSKSEQKARCNGE